MRGSIGSSGMARPRAIIALLNKPSGSASALTFLPDSPVVCPPGARLWVMTRGWAARMRQIGGARRQIFNFLVPGDSFTGALDLTDTRATEIVALTPIQIVPVDEIIRESAPFGSVNALEAACRSAAAEEVNLVLDHLMRLGQHTALERTAHLLLELADRLSAVHMTEDQSFTLPIKQECLAQALGMSPVHLNRTLQKLKAEGLIAMRGSQVTLRQPGRLRRLCDFGCDGQVTVQHAQAFAV